MHTLYNRFLSNTQSGLQMSIRLGVASGLSFFLGTLFNAYADKPSTLIGGLWSVVSTIIVMQNYVGGTFRAAWQRFLGTFLGAAFAGFFVSWLGVDAFAVGICVFCITLLCFMTGLLESFRIASLTSAIVLVLWGVDPEVSPWKFSLLRFFDSVIGISVGLLVSCFFWSAQAKHKMRDNFLFILEKIYQLLQEKPFQEDLQLKKIEEIDKEIRETAPIIEEAKLELIGRHSEFQSWEALFNHLVQMIEALKVLLSLSKKLLDNPKFSIPFSNHFKAIVGAFKTLEAIVLHHADAKITTTPIEDNVLQLKNSLEEFYQAASSKDVSFENASLFFVYYYNLKLFADELEEALKVNVKKI
jgi:uncharacterized membrane protein YgaE (UPF0421/DUF939 family)